MYEHPLRIHMWSGPRNISTAMMYAFRQRPDTHVIDEPLYAHYLARVDAGHPGTAEVLVHMEQDGEKVIRDQILGPCPQPVLFIKHMTHHLVDIHWDFMSGGRHFLLIRDPWEMLPSLARILDHPTLPDTGLALHVQLFHYLRSIGQDPLVVDARELLLSPAAVLRSLCNRLGLTFTDAMLHWPAGPKPEDGVWAKYWYTSAHAAAGFNSWRPQYQPLPGHCESLYAECKPYYDELFQHAIKAPSPESP